MNEKFKELQEKLLSEYDRNEITGHNEDFKQKLMEQLNKLQNETINKNKKYSVEVNTLQLEKMRLSVKN
jgi:hypothetical protein